MKDDVETRLKRMREDWKILDDYVIPALYRAKGELELTDDGFGDLIGLIDVVLAQVLAEQDALKERGEELSNASVS